MDANTAELLRRLALFIPPFILSLTLHEYAHAWVADKLGDQTARYMGRLTIDPMAHMSWVGTVIFPAIGFLTGAPLFGWANPVPIDMRNFRRPRLHMAIVAGAGPLLNLGLAVISTAFLAALSKSQGGLVALRSGTGMSSAAVQMLMMSMQLNLFLAFFNLLPLPPLDGARIVQGLTSARVADAIDRFEQYSQFLLLALFFLGLLRILELPVYATAGLLMQSFGVVA